MYPSISQSEVSCYATSSFVIVSSKAIKSYGSKSGYLSFNTFKAKKKKFINVPRKVEKSEIGAFASMTDISFPLVCYIFYIEDKIN